MLTAEMLKGKKVIGAGGLMIGEIETVLIDVATWKATHLQVGLTDEVAKQLGQKTAPLGISRIGISSKAGMKKPNLSIPIEDVEQVGDVVTVKSGINDLKALEQAATVKM